MEQVLVVNRAALEADVYKRQVRRDVVHNLGHHLFQHRPQASGTDPPFHGLIGHGLQGDVYKRQMQYIKCDVSTICIGMAASMGAFLLAAGTKGKRMALPNAEIMIHQPSAGTQGQITDMAIHLKRLEVIKKRMNHILSENTGKPLDVVTADCERDNFMSAQEAMEYGLIDKVIDKR